MSASPTEPIDHDDFWKGLLLAIAISIALWAFAVLALLAVF